MHSQAIINTASTFVCLHCDVLEAQGSQGLNGHAASAHYAIFLQLLQVWTSDSTNGYPTVFPAKPGSAGSRPNL